MYAFFTSFLDWKKNYLFLVIQICNVKPIPEITPITTANDIPEKIARFYHYNDVKKFQCDRPVHKGVIDKENEIKVGNYQ